jgi:MYXO-CTERM domain-containing protein
MKTKLTNAVKWGLGAVVLSLSTLGHANLITNGTFTVETGWTIFNMGIDTVGNKAFGPKDEKPDARISQAVGTLDPTKIYNLNFSVTTGGINAGSVPFGDQTSAVFIDVTLGTLGFADLDFAISPPGAGPWLFSGAFTGLGGNPLLTISFDAAPTLNLADFHLYNVSLDCDPSSPGGCATTSVPEPGSLLLAGAALASLGLVRRRRSA